MRKEEERAIGTDYKKKMFLGRLNGKKHYSIGRGSEFFDKRPPETEVWDYGR